MASLLERTAGGGGLVGVGRVAFSLGVIRRIKSMELSF